jgi:hypothetical protein
MARTLGRIEPAVPMFPPAYSQRQKSRPLVNSSVTTPPLMKSKAASVSDVKEDNDDDYAFEDVKGGASVDESSSMVCFCNTVFGD